MPKYEKFEDLPVWKEAARLYNLVLDLLEQSGLPLSPGFRNQLDRAALSVSNNIAEGFERVTTGELLAFLAIARGSAGEVRSMVAVVHHRPRLAPSRPSLQQIRAAAESGFASVDGMDRLHRGIAGTRQTTSHSAGENAAGDETESERYAAEVPALTQTRSSALQDRRSPGSAW